MNSSFLVCVGKAGEVHLFSPSFMIRILAERCCSFLGLSVLKYLYDFSLWHLNALRYFTSDPVTIYVHVEGFAECFLVRKF